MSTVLEYINTFWMNYGQWIGVALIPTVITGLAMSPSTEKAGPWVQKAWDVIKMVMNFLSLVTHKDKDGTFQLPLKLGAVLPKKKDDSVEVETSEETKGE